MRGGMLVPLGADLLWKTEGREQETERLMSEVRSVFSYGTKEIDADEYAAALKSVKAMDTFDDTLDHRLDRGIRGTAVLLEVVRVERQSGEDVLGEDVLGGFGV